MQLTLKSATNAPTTSPTTTAEGDVATASRQQSMTTTMHGQCRVMGVSSGACLNPVTGLTHPLAGGATVGGSALKQEPPEGGRDAWETSRHSQRSATSQPSDTESLNGLGARTT